MEQSPERRRVLKLAAGMLLCPQFLERAAAEEVDSRKAPPKAGDGFVFADGERKGQPITNADLPLGGPPVAVYAMDPETKVVKDASRLNKILLIHLDPKDLAEETRPRAADGTVAYTAVCPHQGCDVSGWHDEKKTFLCACHWAAFDPRDGARVVAGPAPRPLAMLPLKVADGVLVAAGGFVGRVGVVR